MGMFEKPFVTPSAGKTYLPSDKTSIRRFQVYHRLPTTGKLDGPTQAKMRATNTHIQVTDSGPTVTDQMAERGGDSMSPPRSRALSDGGATTATQQRRFKGDRMPAGRQSKTFRS